MVSQLALIDSGELMKKIFLILPFFLYGCLYSAPKVPTTIYPPVPNNLLVQKSQPNDRQLGCSEAKEEFQYYELYKEYISRVFDQKGPYLMNPQTYGVTNSIFSSYGKSTTGFSSTSIYGGGSVMVYDDLSYRAMQINRSIDARSSEVRHIVSVNGSCGSDLLRSTQSEVNHTFALLNSAKRDLERNRKIRESNAQQMRELEAQPNMRGMAKIMEAEAAKQEEREETRIRELEATYSHLLARHRSMHEKAEQDALKAFRYFLDNAKVEMR